MLANMSQNPIMTGAQDGMAEGQQAGQDMKAMGEQVQGPQRKGDGCIVCNLSIPEIWQGRRNACKAGSLGLFGYSTERPYQPLAWVSCPTVCQTRCMPPIFREASFW